jgi:DNA repair protein SbcC/Rad50
MRLHGLTVTAFGPFPGTEHVDFDELNDAGLFLLTGPTGAGKSSLLDAVCFALYGTVPGERGVKTLRSQHAPVDVRPEVVLDLTLQGRRFVVRRSPEWARPKRRGDGLVVEKASASLLETTGGTEHLLSARAAEVGHTLSLLMGMSVGQFMQVALLPQGGFQTFLRASSQERHEVLQQLFRTDRFTRIEHWVDDHGRLLRARAAAGEAEVRRLVHAVADRTCGCPPQELDGDALPEAAAAGRVLAWVDGSLTEAEATAGARRAVDEAARRELETARHRHEDALRRTQLRARVEAARQTLIGLDEGEVAAEAERARLSANDRAARCGPVTQLLQHARLAHAEAAARRDTALEACGTSVPVRLEPTRAALARLEAVLPREREADRLREEAARLASRLEAADRDLATTADLVAALPARLAACTEALSAAAAQAARGEAVSLALTSARARRDAAGELAGLEPRLVEVDDARRDARDRMQDAREDVQALAARRLAGMAAELAGALADGSPCQVCGSPDHPQPAGPASDAVTDADQQAADEVLRARAAAFESADEAARGLRVRRDALAATAEGLGVEEAGAVVEVLEQDLAAVSAAEQRAALLGRERDDLLQEQSDLSARHAAVVAEAAGLREAVAGAQRARATAAAQVRDVLGDEPGPVADAVARTRGLLDRLEAAHRVLTELEEVRCRVVELERQAAATAAEHGFAAADDVERSLLTEPDRGRLEAALRERDDARVRARAVLDDAAAQDLPGALDDEEALDVGALRAALELAEAAAAGAARELALADDRVAVLRRQRRELDAALERWAPQRDEALRAESLSRLVRGLGHDNQLQMRLSAYVLATRLDQVVAAANERLAQMRDQRYLLQRTGRAERKGSRAGLGLEVVDQWTGDVRAPTTLSGGETFVVSLALALGLADVVTHEAGGTEVETLFVDEGFGTLDADTLDDVMDRLDGLRSGGRTVGVVSHVTELRSRIPTQVQVEKGRSGSTVAVRTLVG